MTRYYRVWWGPKRERVMINSGEKLVSIIIPVYQAKGSIRECVASCLGQKKIADNELELILVDDGSTDGSAELCDEIEHEDKLGRIKVIHTENHGVSHARNTGLEEAVGRFVTFVDADDLVKEEFIENLMKYADETTSVVDETDSFLASHKISGFQYIENSVLNRNTHVWGKLFDRKTLCQERISFREDLTIGEDLIFMLDFAISQGERHTVRCIPSGNYLYTDNEQGAMNRRFRPSYLDQIRCWRWAEDKLTPYSSKFTNDTFVSVADSQIMTALLVIGKIAVIDEDKRDKGLTELAVSEVTRQIKHALKTDGSFVGLSLGYKVKVLLYLISPGLYLKLYNRHKSGA